MQYQRKFEISGLPKKLRPTYEPKVMQEGTNVMFRPNENKRALRQNTRSMIKSQQSNFYLRRAASNDLLRQQASFHSQLNKEMSQNNFNHKMTGIQDLEHYNEKIVAKKSFFLNPSKNNPKIIKTVNKLYVI